MRENAYAVSIETLRWERYKWLEFEWGMCSLLRWSVQHIHIIHATCTNIEKDTNHKPYSTSNCLPIWNARSSCGQCAEPYKFKAAISLCFAPTPCGGMVRAILGSASMFVSALWLSRAAPTLTAAVTLQESLSSSQPQPFLFSLSRPSSSPFS